MLSNWDGGEGLIIVPFLLSLHILALKCPHQGLPLGRLANSQVTLTWRSAQFMGHLKDWGGPPDLRGRGWSVDLYLTQRERARESTGERVRGSTLQNRSPSLPDLWARCPDPPVGTGTRLSKEQAGQEMAAGPQLGAGKLAHRRLRRGGNLFWMWDPDGARGVGGEESEAR